MSADELLRLRDRTARHELVRGELRTMPFRSFEHGCVVAATATNLAAYVHERGLGVVVINVGFQIERDPDTVLSVDIAFVSAERDVDTEGFFPGPPDGAIEVVSAADLYADIQEKTLALLRAVCRVVVVVDPRTRSVRVHRSTGAIAMADAIAIEDVVPGWSLPLAKIFR